jgi:YegS/Rv2252/BmrU family lipid kinase
MKRLLVLLNPRAHAGEAPDDAAAFETRLRDAGFAVRLVRLERPVSIDAVIDAHAAECDAIVVGGGDGTMGSALPGVLRAGKPMGVWPRGTANDFARSLGIENDDDAIAALTAWDESKIDVADVNGRFFINNVTVGLPAEAAARLTPDLKRRLGVFASVALVPALWRHAEPFDVRIDADGRSERRRVVAAMVGNGVYEGGFPIRYSGLADGKLHLSLVRVRSRWELFPILLDVLLRRAGGSKRIERFAAERVTLATPTLKRIAADGDIVSQTPATIVLHASALTVLRHRSA